MSRRYVSLMLAGFAGWLGSVPAWQEEKQRQRREKHDPKEPGQVIIGQYRRLPIDQIVHQGEGLALGRNRITCLTRQTRRQRGIIARIGAVQVIDMRT